jgi:hypothetical protein
MTKIDEISVWDLPDIKEIPDGYDRKSVPDISARNIAILMEKINEVIRAVNQILPPG